MPGLTSVGMCWEGFGSQNTFFQQRTRLLLQVCMQCDCFGVHPVSRGESTLLEGQATY